MSEDIDNAVSEPHDFFADPELGARFARVDGIFRAHDILGVLVNRILDAEKA